MTLDYNPKHNCFYLITNDRGKAEKAGLTLSTAVGSDGVKVFGPNGESAYYTSDYDKKAAFNPYAVLAFYNEATPRAKELLNPFKRDFDLSWSQDDFAYPAKGGKAYLPYQNAGIRYGTEKGSVLIGDEPGLGKTVQALGIANETKARNILVVCPASIRLNWRREILRWWEPESGAIHPLLYLQSRGGSFPSIDINAVVVSYELTRNEGVFNAIREREWDLMVLDEAHYLKTTDANRTRAVFGGGNGLFRDKWIAQKVDRTVALTGTPLPNRPRECFTLAKALCPESIDWMSYDDFCFRFNPSQRMTSKDDKIFNVEKRGRLPELQARLRSNFMVRRLKKDVLKDLPEKRYELTYIEPTGKIQEVLMRESLLDFKITDLKDPFSDVWGMISTIRKEMGIAKIPRVVEHMKFLLDVMEVPKVVLFAHHVEVMNQLTVELERFGVVAVRGGMSSVAKDHSVQSFRNDPAKRIFLGQLDAAGFGIDGLQDVCDYVVFAEPAWVPGTNEQAVDRLHRIGQNNRVLAQFLVVEGSFDEKVMATVFEKNETIYNVLDKVH